MNIILNIKSSTIKYGMEDKCLFARWASEHATGFTTHRRLNALPTGLRSRPRASSVER